MPPESAEPIVRAVLFASDSAKLAEFYLDVLGMKRSHEDEYHAVLRQPGFDLIVHQLPQHIAAKVKIASPPVRRESGSMRLDFRVANVATSRDRASSLGGGIDDSPPPWAEPGTRFFLGFDPEGNVFGIEQAGESAQGRR